MLTIEQKTCQRDGLCQAVCPMGLLITDDEGYPRLRDDGEEFCIACGHCRAICPNAALTNTLLPETEAPGFFSEPTVSTAAVRQLLQSRRSTRQFRDQPVSRERIAALIEACRWAPSAANHQPVHWLVVHEPAEVHRLAGLVAEFLRHSHLGARYATIVERWDQGQDPILRGAPHLVIAHGEDDWPWATVDCTIALSQFELVAAADGLGTCWAGFLIRAANAYPPLREVLGLPAGHSVCGAMMLGVPRYRYRQVPPRREAQITWR
jgi:nitroreductase/NAD-dependent dihydropyrimidine dehydrogenase PreA subunit